MPLSPRACAADILQFFTYRRSIQPLIQRHDERSRFLGALYAARLLFPDGSMRLSPLCCRDTGLYLCHAIIVFIVAAQGARILPERIL
jgi:hypothetical protein